MHISTATVAVPLIMALLLAVGTSIIGLACFDPSDRYSMEVVLSKPGVKYDLGVFDTLPGVMRINGKDVYVWRSHVEPSSIVVIVSLQPLSWRNNAEKYISIRVEGKTIVVNNTTRIYFAETRIPEKISVDKLRSVFEEYGWSINAYTSGDYVKALLYKNIDNTTITVSITASYTNGETTLSISTRLKGNINDNLILNDLKKALHEVFGSIDIEFSKETIVEQTIKPGSNIAEKLLKQALEYELKWLIKLKVINGLTSNDLERILSSIREGMAGWNSRLVYFNGEWKPYYEVVKEIPGGALIKTSTGCTWDYPEELIPPTPPPPYHVEESMNNTTPLNTINNNSTQPYAGTTTNGYVEGNLSPTTTATSSPNQTVVAEEKQFPIGLREIIMASLLIIVGTFIVYKKLLKSK